MVLTSTPFGCVWKSLETMAINLVCEREDAHHARGFSTLFFFFLLYSYRELYGAHACGTYSTREPQVFLFNGTDYNTGPADRTENLDNTETIYFQICFFLFFFVQGKKKIYGSVPIHIKIAPGSVQHGRKEKQEKIVNLSVCIYRRDDGYL